MSSIPQRPLLLPESAYVWYFLYYETNYPSRKYDMCLLYDTFGINNILIVIYITIYIVHTTMRYSRCHHSSFVQIPFDLFVIINTRLLCTIGTSMLSFVRNEEADAQLLINTLYLHIATSVLCCLKYRLLCIEKTYSQFIL